MLIIAGNILPIFFLILIGFLCKQSGFPGNNFWVPAERLAYYVLLPALIIRNLTNTDLSTLPTGPMALAIFSLGAAHNREVAPNLPRKKTLPSAEPS